MSALTLADATELSCKAHLGVWMEEKRGFTNSPLQWEWSELAMELPKACIVAPRDHSKSETWTVSQAAWRCRYVAGTYVFIFSSTDDLAKDLKARIDLALEQTDPWMLRGSHTINNVKESLYANHSRVKVAGVGKKVRGGHPDHIIGDDVLAEESCLTSYQRRKTSRWWSGTVGGMSHPGEVRTIGKYLGAPKAYFPPTTVHLVGTPFHRQDLLMSMRENGIYRFRRYAAEYDERDLVDGLAVEVA